MPVRAELQPLHGGIHQEVWRRKGLGRGLRRVSHCHPWNPGATTRRESVLLFGSDRDSTAFRQLDPWMIRERLESRLPRRSVHTPCPVGAMGSFGHISFCYCGFRVSTE